MTRPPSREHPARSAWAWVLDVAPAIRELDRGDLADLAAFDQRLHTHLHRGEQVIPAPRHQPRPTLDPDRDAAATAAPRAAALLAARAALCAGTVTGPLGCAPAHLDAEMAGDMSSAARVRAALAQTVRQFLAGYRDVDLRDVSGAGHGAMILNHARPAVGKRWAARLDAGALAGTAMTEPRGGSRLRTPATRLMPDGPGRWRLHGAKRWISRLQEAAVFVVSATDPDGRTVAVLVDTDRTGLTRGPEEPAGLSGWSWGALDLDGVAVDEDDLLVHRCGPPGPFAAHFAGYRQLVTATALGGAAGVVSQVITLLGERTDRGEIARVSDHALITLAAADAALRAAWHECLHTARLVAHGHPEAIARSAAAKAHGIETARRAADDLAALAGAAGFTREHPIAKTRADLEALRFADGAHDSLRRHAGAQLLDPPATSVDTPTYFDIPASTDTRDGDTSQ